MIVTKTPRLALTSLERGLASPARKVSENQMVFVFKLTKKAEVLVRKPSRRPSGHGVPMAKPSWTSEVESERPPRLAIFGEAGKFHARLAGEAGWEI